jgi:predicted nucleic-acid-binding protein
MTQAGSLDTNVILRALLNDIPEQNQAALRLLGSTDGQFAVADIALVEVGFALERFYHFSRTQIAEVIIGFTLQPQISCNRILFDRALAIFQSHPALSLEDCCLAVYAELNSATPLYTFDKKLAKQVQSATLLV